MCRLKKKERESERGVGNVRNIGDAIEVEFVGAHQSGSGLLLKYLLSSVLN